MRVQFWNWDGIVFVNQGYKYGVFVYYDGVIIVELVNDGNVILNYGFYVQQLFWFFVLGVECGEFWLWIFLYDSKQDLCKCVVVVLECVNEQMYLLRIFC